MSQPTSLISVIIPVYNGERYLSQALESVLAQAQPPNEIIVVDDGSTDGTAALVQSMGKDIHCFHQSNQGPAAARNRGLEMAYGDIIAFQDADDLWTPGRLSLQLEMLARHPTAHAVIGRTVFFSADEPSPTFTMPTDVVPTPRWFLGLHCGLYRRSAFTIVGKFNAALRYHEDIDWFRRARAAAISIHPHDDVVLLHRRHASNMTNDRVGLNAELLHMLRLSPRRPPAADDSLLAWLTTESADCGNSSGRSVL